ncbi:MAG: hypothetical protein LBL23_09130 [Coriobacteriales bacterium]|jgi:hypothetical protein|nr:hypothetical protein [Coriobacteriales bacterium]
MAFSESLTMALTAKEDWTGYTFAEVRSAIEAGLALTLSPPGGEEECEFWSERCKNEIDYLLYVFAGTQLLYTMIYPDMGIEEVLKKCNGEAIDKNGKRNFFVCYLNTYFYRYIKNIEIPKIQEIVKVNPELSRKQAIDFYITQLLYFDVVKANEGMFFIYEDINDVPSQRKHALNEIANKVVAALADNDERALFENIFLLMTFFAGSNFRRVHASVTAIIGIGMADFRQLFHDNLDRIIENKGNIRIGGITA